jgi:hypothetical protein
MPMPERIVEGGRSEQKGIPAWHGAVFDVRSILLQIPELLTTGWAGLFGSPNESAGPTGVNTTCNRGSNNDDTGRISN